MAIKKVTEILIDEFVRLYVEEEWPAPKIARELGFGPSTVYRYLKRSGILPSQHGRIGKGNKGYKFAVEIEQQIAQEYETGQSALQLSMKHGCCLSTILGVVRRHGGYVRQRGGKRKLFSPEQQQQIIELYSRQGLSQQIVAEKLGVTIKRIQQSLRQHGIIVRKMSGEHHGSWKGGRTINRAGYVLVRPSFDDPHIDMIDSNSYVMEHRLIMARALGRSLYPWETVHHIDGDPANNVLSNLQLRVGNHGHHIAYRCADCGSRDIEPYELSPL